ncbi:MAG: murein L,D-transpeptidase [Bdellovibrionales bacterium]
MMLASPTVLIRCALLALALVAWAPEKAMAFPFWSDDSQAKAIEHDLSAPTEGAIYRLDRPALRLLYQPRGFEPFWQTSEEEDRVALKKFVQSMQVFVAYHGLIAEDYPVQEMRGELEASGEITPQGAAKLDLLVTDWLLKIARDLDGRRVNLTPLYVGWSFTRPARPLLGELAAAIEQGTVQAFLDSLQPSDPDYTALAQALARYRAIQANGGWPVVPYGETMREGQRDGRLVRVRQRLVAEGYEIEDYDEDTDESVFTPALRVAVRAYQANNGLEVDGDIGSRTLRAMNVSVGYRISQIEANMERLRHMTRHLPDRYAQVNIASTMLKVVEDGEVIYEAPVVAGRADRKTPFIQSKIRSVIFNPSWHVPASIARRDILPKLRKDPHYLEKMGFVIKGGASGDPHGAEIDWDEISAGEFAFRLRQAPGEMNALGRIKFDFDNNFSVYMHGTPHEELFAKSRRHLSSGCVRLRDPENFAVIVLAGNQTDWTLERVEDTIHAGKTRWLQVTEPLPVYFIYQTAFPSEDSDFLQFRPDDYNYDRILLEALDKPAS